METKSQEKPVKAFFFFHGVIARAQIFRKKYPENTAVCRQRNHPPHPQKTAAGTSKSERLQEQNAGHMSKISEIFDTSSPICRKNPKSSTRHQPYVEIIQNLRHVTHHMYTAWTDETSGGGISEKLNYTISPHHWIHLKKTADHADAAWRLRSSSLFRLRRNLLSQPLWSC